MPTCRRPNSICLRSPPSPYSPYSILLVHPAWQLAAACLPCSFRGVVGGWQVILLQSFGSARCLFNTL